MQRKVFEIEVDGVVRGFRFNMLSHAKAEKLLETDLVGLAKRISQKDLEAILIMMYAGAVNYTEGKGLKVDYTAADVTDWLESAGLEKVQEMLLEAMKTPTPKNLEAPATGQSQSQSA